MESEYWLTRLIFQRALAFIYLIGFAIAINQGRALIGHSGLQPMHLFLQRVKFWDAPSVLWMQPSDNALLLVAGLGIGLSLFALSGFSENYGLAVSMITWACLWVLYSSIVNVGQIFYGYGWEILLLESGFLAIFLGSKDVAVPVIVIWLLRWLLFRVMLGAGLIKIRGDSCWRDLTCMFYHYETQPLPNPLSAFFHRLPQWIHKAEVLFTHFVELIVPFGYFGPGLLRILTGLLTVIFQFTLILSGNLSWLNYITIVLCIPLFDDSFFRLFLSPSMPGTLLELPWFHKGVAWALAGVVGILSVRPALNLISGRQLMNASFDPLHLVNTYGAFGSITRVRQEVVLEGTDDDFPGTESEWKEYEFKCKPGDPKRRPCIVSPYHFKLDWQMWFAAMSPYWDHPWLLNLVAKLLRNDQAVLSLMAKNPFPDKAPNYIRASLYEYHFTKAGDEAWWERKRVATYLPALSLGDSNFQSILSRMGWNEEDL